MIEAIVHAPKAGAKQASHERISLGTGTRSVVFRGMGGFCMRGFGVRASIQANGKPRNDMSSGSVGRNLGWVVCR